MLATHETGCGELRAQLRAVTTSMQAAVDDAHGRERKIAEQLRKAEAENDALRAASRPSEKRVFGEAMDRTPLNKSIEINPARACTQSAPPSRKRPAEDRAELLQKPPRGGGIRPRPDEVHQDDGRDRMRRAGFGRDPLFAGPGPTGGAIPQGVPRGCVDNFSPIERNWTLLTHPSSTIGIMTTGPFAGYAGFRIGAAPRPPFGDPPATAAQVNVASQKRMLRPSGGLRKPKDPPSP